MDKQELAAIRERVEKAPLKELRDYLLTEAEWLLSQAFSRRQYAESDRKANAAELRDAKKLAEQMTGRKLDLVKSTVAEARRNASMQERIAAKLEQESKKYCQWAEALSDSEALVRELATKLETIAWTFRSDFPHNPFCQICGVGQDWASEHGHEKTCILAEPSVRRILEAK